MGKEEGRSTVHCNRWHLRPAIDGHGDLGASN